MSATENRSERPNVSINSHHLTYPPVLDARPVSRSIMARAVPLSVAVLAALVILAAATMLSIQAVWAQDSSADGTVKLQSVQFDFDQAQASDSGPLSASGAAAEARYRLVVIRDRGSEARLQPLPGRVEVSLTAEHAAATTAEINGLQIGHANADFGNALADAVSSGSVHRFARLAATAGGGPVSINVFYSRRLTADDYLLIQEAGGNAAVKVTAISRDGEPLGKTLDFGPRYQWNSGQGPESLGTSWASVVDVAGFGPTTESIAGIRITGANAEVKAVALSALIDSPDLPPRPGSVGAEAQGAAAGSGAAAAAPGDPSNPQTPRAAVGLESKIQPALAVDGAGCADGDSQGSSEFVAGQAATFCFTVTNLGAADLTDITITDERLGLIDAKLPKVAGPEVLGPGQQAIYYYHSVVDERPPDAASIVTARSTVGSGDPTLGLVEATASSAPGEVGPPSELVESAVPPVLAAGELPASASNPAAVAGSAAPSPLNETMAVTELALTGMVTEPWVIVIFAMAFIFIGYTVYAAFQRRQFDDEPCGHDQLDSLGFD